MVAGSRARAGSRRPARLASVCIVLAGSVASAAALAADPPSPPPPPPATAVVVTADRLAVETRIDRTVYSISTDAQSVFGTVSDVLAVIPSIDVDAEGTVSLRGDSNVLILIDGRPAAQLSGSGAGDSLQSIPAQDIERIEVITTPPAQFKADGASGVINIVTRRKSQAGLSGSAQASLGSSGRSVVGGSLSDGRGPLTLSASASLRKDLRQRLVRSSDTAIDPATGLASTSDNQIVETIHRAVPLVKLAGAYALGSHDTVRLSVDRSGRSGNRYYTEDNQVGLPGGIVTASTERQSRGHDWSINSDQRLSYEHKAGPEDAELGVVLHRTTRHEREHYDYLNRSFEPLLPDFGSNLSFREDLVTTEFGVDYSRPLGGHRTLKAGYDVEEDDFRFGNAGNTLDPVTGSPVVDPNLTNDFAFIERVQAAYLSYESNGDRWSWLVGLRAEWVFDDARQLTDRTSTDRNYLRLYPSLHVNRRLSDAASLTFGASRRVSRPDPSDLNPYVDHEYAPTLRAGNPALRPQDTWSFETGYAYEAAGSIRSATLYYRRNRGSVTDVTEYLGNGVSLSTKTNLPRNDSAGLELIANGRVSSMLGYTLSANLFRSEIDATALGSPGLRSTSGINAKAKLDFHPRPTVSGQLTVTRSDRRLTPQGTVNAVTVVNLGFRQQFAPSLAAVATLSDAFNGQQYERTVVTPLFTEDYRRSVRGRIGYVGLVYIFGGTPKSKPQNFEYDQ